MRESSEEVGSSRITRRGGASVEVNARAISTIWRWPSANSPTGRSTSMPWPGKIRSRAARIRTRAVRFQPSPRIAGCTTRVFSAEDRFGQSASSWNTTRMPAACAALGVQPWPCRVPAISSVPSSAENTPARMLTSVLLPAPLWPIRPNTSPGAMTRSAEASAVTAPKRFTSPVARTVDVSIIDAPVRAPFRPQSAGVAGAGLPAAAASIICTDQSSVYLALVTAPSGVCFSQ